MFSINYNPIYNFKILVAQGNDFIMVIYDCKTCFQLGCILVLVKFLKIMNSYKSVVLDFSYCMTKDQSRDSSPYC